jgi:cytosine deaminase
MITQTVEDAVRIALYEAQNAACKGSYGVGGVMIDLRNGKVVHTMQNTVITNGRLIDPTAHGERQLVDWYYAQTNRSKLPRPKNAIIVTSLDPCCMCTGSILAGGFHAVISALDDTAGINFDGKNRFLPFDKPLKSFYYPKVIDGTAVVRRRYGALPDIFAKKNLSKDIVDNCGNVFIEGARKARDVVNGMSLSKEQLKNPKDAPHAMIDALKKVYPQALEYTAPRPGYPDRGLSRYLEQAAQADLNNGGDGDAAAFLDYNGNLLLCMPGNKNKSPIRSAYMEMIRAYTRLRYDLTEKNIDALYYLHEPKHGTIVMYKGFDKSASSFADLGAYGSTILGELNNERNLLYCNERIAHNKMMKYIQNMPPRYRNLIKPQPIRL